MVEQNARRALAMSDRGYVLDLGKDRFEGPGQELLDDPKVAELYLGGTARIDRPEAAPEADRPRKDDRGPQAPAARMRERFERWADYRQAPAPPRSACRSARPPRP